MGGERQPDQLGPGTYVICGENQLVQLSSLLMSGGGESWLGQLGT